MNPFWIALLLVSTTYHTINVDGQLDDFSSDELIIADSPSDSRWGEMNEIFNIYLTWDSTSLYVGADYILQYNAILIVLDFGDAPGDYDINDLDWYPRNFSFRGMKPRILIAVWNSDQPTGGVHKLLGNGRTEVLSGASFVVGARSGKRGGLEAAIPFSSAFSSGHLEPGATVKVVALIAGGDNSTGGDAAPDNQLIGAPNVIDRFAELVVDSDSNGVADEGISPQAITQIVQIPPIALKMELFQLSDRVIHAEDGLTASFAFTENLDGTVCLHDEVGRQLTCKAFSVEPHETLTVNFDTNGLPPGLYFVKVNTPNIVERKTFAVVKP